MLIIDSDKCTACGVCESSCAFGAISVQADCAVVNESCTLCGACVENCPEQALRIETAAKRVQADLGEYAGIMVFAEYRHGKIAPVSYELLGIGRKLADQRGVKLSAVLPGGLVSDLAQSLIAAGADIVLLAEHPLLEQFREDFYAKVLESAIRKRKPEVVLAGATAIGRSVVPYVATAINAGLTADCTRLEIREEDGMLLQTRPAFGGNIMATIECPQTRPQMATVRPKVMAPAEPDATRTGEVIFLQLPTELLQSRVEVLETVVNTEDQVNIQEFETLVAGGRGLDSAKGFALIRDLAAELGGAVAASRAAVDAGWIPYPHQVGQTGKTVSPKLYVACGISGAVQHAVGMQSAEIVVAINRDKDAPIFDIATYGVVGDLYEVVPRLIQRLQEIKK
ncbi:MAG: electron transfer flavoprotein subunit alpha [Desulfobulbus sp.]|jgi:electron transfer flavoprotein alpha subunit|uniref:electron transfer flavoprotein subunit alpha n=1 Tax=Desulfobulbus sp. TaxID=895 RepID=UPI0028453B8E|nr:electron transfer flavoprotein subunit alpha [Desulfobulbus sp.]MDR2550551.1 electron transfer flavoprotein subunit alpha [Desulfobulbus sp.]